MITITERVAHQSAGGSAFAEIEVAVILGEQPGRTRVEFSTGPELFEGDFYLPAVQVGTALALRLAPQRTQLAVKVRRLHTTIVDTTELLVVFTSARAILRALDADPELVGAIDFRSRSVTFKLS